MNTNSYMLKVGLVEALVVRKEIKHVHLSVLPPEGRIRVTAPIAMNDDAIRILLATRLGWIKKQQTKFRGQARQAAREYVSGESHYLFGKRYRLDVRYQDQVPSVETRANGKLILFARPGASKEKREEILTEWYREQLHSVVAELVERWEQRIGVRAKRWNIQRMKTRWGSCNKRTGRILLNLELAKKPASCVEYVVVHELVHLIEKSHNERFIQLMTKHLPKWRSEKQELNLFVLSHEEWPA